MIAQTKQKNFFIVISKYLVFFLLFYLMAKSSVYGLIFPFAVGLFFALIWCNQKIIILAPIYAVASLIVNFSLISVISVLCTIFISLIIFGIHIKIKKPIKLWLFTLYILLSQIGYLFAEIYFNNVFVVPILTVICSILFMFACKEILGILLIRGMVYKPNLVEVLCGLVVLCAVSGGLYQTEIVGVELIKVFACLIILLVSQISSISTTILVASVIGLSGLVCGGNTIYIAPFIIWALISSAFKTQRKIVPTLTLLLVELCMGYYLNMYGTYGLTSVLSVVIACFAFLILPKAYLGRIADFCAMGENSLAMRNVVNRSRENLCKRLYGLSEVFSEMDYVFRSMIKGGMTKEQVKMFLIGEVKDKVCVDCPEKNMCHRMCLEETSGVFENLIASALERGKTTLLDIPPYLTTRCTRISNLVNAVNQLCLQYRQYAGVMNNLDASRVLIAEQLSGVSKIMKNLAGEVNKNISFDSNREEIIINELSYNNIVCSDAVIYEQNADVVSATLVVRKSDADKSHIPQIVSKICKNKMVVVEQLNSARAGWNVLTLITAPKYDVVFGTATCAKDGSKISGDCYSVIKIAPDKFLLALCDGMGSGEKAERTSSLAIGLVENFYKAGFDNDMILSSINKLLSLNKEEIFSALDVCVIDTRKGVADFIKMGAPNSYVKHISTISKIEGGTLPLGIVQDIEPMIIKKVLQVGDFVFLFTDGVSDSFSSEDMLEDYINNMKSLNPQILAEELINKAIKNNNGVRDDMTILVAKIFNL